MFIIQYASPPITFLLKTQIMHINVKNSKTISTLTFIDCIANSISKYDNAVTRIIAAPGLWAQRITTKEPDEKMCEVAIKAMKAVIPEDGSDIVQ